MRPASENTTQLYTLDLPFSSSLRHHPPPSTHHIAYTAPYTNPAPPVPTVCLSSSRTFIRFWTLGTEMRNQTASVTSSVIEIMQTQKNTLHQYSIACLPIQHSMPLFNYDLKQVPACVSTDVCCITPQFLHLNRHCLFFYTLTWRSRWPPQLPRALPAQRNAAIPPPSPTETKPTATLSELGVEKGRSMPARVHFTRVASDKCADTVAGKIAVGQLRGACNPVARRVDDEPRVLTMAWFGHGIIATRRTRRVHGVRDNCCVPFMTLPLGIFLLYSSMGTPLSSRKTMPHTPLRAPVQLRCRLL